VISRKGGVIFFIVSAVLPTLAGVLRHCHPAIAGTLTNPDAATHPPAPLPTPPNSIFVRDGDSALEGLRAAPAADGGALDSSPSRGKLDKEIIRRVIGGHINEVESCYDAALTTDPTFSGRIMIRFTIAATGSVDASELQSSTMANPVVESCAVQVAKRWQFPKPIGGGSVVVSYPFVLTPVPFTLVSGMNGAGALQIEWVDDRVLVHRSNDAAGVPSNGLIVITDRGLMLVDTAWTDTQTDAVLRFGRERLKRSWIGAVITHDHRDRAGGIGALMRAGIPVAALDLTVAKLEKRGVHGVKTLFTATAGQIRDERGFEAFYPGPGHTSDNIVLAFPARNFVFGGCLIKAADASTLGFTGDADQAAWPAAVRRVAERYPAPRALIPGHGPVDRSAATYRRTLDLLSSQRGAGP
jgi:metallo-beta-lactamase class B